jgi:hypothetical protein
MWLVRRVRGYSPTLSVLALEPFCQSAAISRHDDALAHRRSTAYATPLDRPGTLFGASPHSLRLGRCRCTRRQTCEHGTLRELPRKMALC